VGYPNLAVPQGRKGTFSARLLSRYQRNEKAWALVLALMEMYLEGDSTRKVKEITEELCGTLRWLRHSQQCEQASGQHHFLRQGYTLTG